jgi:F-type H+-transporting ATPase subunit a
MVLIELVSSLIRPLTLSIRLSANMIAGHLLICLLGNFLIFLGKSFIMTFPVRLILSFLEVSVSLIQSYVFITLLSLYFVDVKFYAQKVSCFSYS